MLIYSRLTWLIVIWKTCVYFKYILYFCQAHLIYLYVYGSTSLVSYLWLCRSVKNHGRKGDGSLYGTESLFSSLNRQYFLHPALACLVQFYSNNLPDCISDNLRNNEIILLVSLGNSNLKSILSLCARSCAASVTACSWNWLLHSKFLR